MQSTEAAQNINWWIVFCSILLQFAGNIVKSKFYVIAEFAHGYTVPPNGQQRTLHSVTTNKTVRNIFHIGTQQHVINLFI